MSRAEIEAGVVVLVVDRHRVFHCVVDVLVGNTVLARRWMNLHAAIVVRNRAHIDRNFNEFQGNAWGLFGWFECEDDADAARALLHAAERWLRERERDRMVGPMDFTTNDEIGVLIAGHEHPPIILCPWHHRYYQRLFEQDVGIDKAMDLCMWSHRRGSRRGADVA